MTTASLARKYEPRKVPVGPDGERVATSAMIASLAAEGYDAVPAPFGRALVDLARTDEKVVGLSADLSKYTDLHKFANAMPDRFYQMGMAEQVLMSAAAGLARDGGDVLVVSSGLMTMRALDAAVALEKDGINVAVLHVPTIKPLDVDAIVAQAGKGSRLVVRRRVGQQLLEAAYDMPAQVPGRAHQPVGRKINDWKRCCEWHEFTALQFGQAQGEAVQR